MFKRTKCKQCEGVLKETYSFCPYCGLDLRNPEAELRDFGMLGKNDEVLGAPLTGGMGGMGINERMLGSLFSNVMKMLEKQLQNSEIDPEELDALRPVIERLPNGIKISVGAHAPREKAKKREKKVITDEQIQRMSKLPRGEAKADVRRFSDKVVYELKAPGVEHIDDIFVSKLENGYEVKAIGKTKVYVNSIPVNLPLKQYSIKDHIVNMEFGLQ